MTDFADILGQEAAKRAMTIALAGNHSVLLIGPAGNGKTLLRSAAREIGDIRIDEVREITAANGIWDIHVEMPRVPWASLMRGHTGTSTKQVRDQIQRAVKTAESPHLMPPATTLLSHGYTDLRLSVQAYKAVLRVARTIASLDGSTSIIDASHIAEALQYRLLERVEGGAA